MAEKDKNQKMWELAAGLGIPKPTDEELAQAKAERNASPTGQDPRFGSTIKYRSIGPVDEQSGFGRKRRKL